MSVSNQTQIEMIEKAHQEWLCALDAVSSPIFLHDKDFRILRCNKAYRAFAGLPYTDIIGRLYYEVFPKSVAPMPQCAHALETSSTSEGSEEEISVDDKLFQSRGYIIRDEEGVYLYSLHILEDITEQRRIERSLYESEAKFRSITDSAQDAILMMDNAGNISFWNFAATAMFGYTYDETIGKSLHELLAPQRYLKAHYKAFPNFQETGEGAAVGKTLELSAVRKDGSEFPIELSISSVKRNGEWHAISIIRDISERKRTQEMLWQSEEKFRSLVESTSDWIWEIDNNGFYTYSSPKVKELLGYDPEELIGTSPFDLMPTEEAQRIKNTFAEILQTASPIRSLENTNRCKNGTLKIIETNGIPFFDENGKLAGFRGIDRDITERKMIEASVKRANRALKTLSAVNMALVHAKIENEFLKTVTEIITKQAGYSLAAVIYANNDTQKSILLASGSGIDPDDYEWANEITWADTPKGQLPVSVAIRTGKTQVCHSIACDIGYKIWKESALSQGYIANIALPLINSETVFGALCIYSKEEGAFDPEEVKLLQELAGDLSYGIINLRARIEHEHQSALLRESLEQSIQTIAATVEARDPYTAGHQRRVAELAVAIAQEMGMDEEQIRGIHFAAIIHDLGKIHIPAEILAKPGRLNEIEFMLIKTHSQEGYNIIKDVRFPWPIAETIWQHHEKLDGSGYPRGLRGDEIRLEARILTVSDVVEAMYSHRPYRPAMGIKAALAEIQRGRGIVYDSIVVDTCIHLFEEKEFTFSSYS